MKKTTLPALFFAFSLFSEGLLAQSIGINTTTPDPSAALDIKDPQRGVLLPRVVLKSKNDNTTIINPATSLLVYSFTAAPTMSAGPGFYYNEGTPQAPSWRSLADLKLPYVATGAEDVMIDLQNYSNNTNSSTLHLSNVQGYALTTEGKLKLAGNGQSPGLGKVLTSDAAGNATWEGGVAFRASGPVLGGSEKMGSAEAKIPFATQEYDLGNNYNIVGQQPHSTFNAPVKGVYHFDVGASWSYDIDIADQKARVSLIRSRAGVTTVLATTVGSIGNYGVTLSADAMLNANDQVYVVILHTASQKYIYLQDPVFFSGRLMVKQ
ncbi:hypothetical protein [Dyadobacter sandarakinus]|uniref:C1q domain-containing protein n=1 Tax=Dyadobacter sandarakinus TaxID=2747268 RepID=A0ABX7I6V9_9BACT|nr:hypothetical protein [Dyadobacter sandarakinus]QRR01834.1 hypothetical protein HWI92_13405 [Dyadobacter sandarakinus]